MYGVNVLMSESFQSKLSPAVKQGLRRVDVVCLKGSSIPMAIYTCDRSNALWITQKAVDKFGAVCYTLRVSNPGLKSSLLACR